MVSRFPSTGFNQIQTSIFTHTQLRQILASYSEGVLTKNWRDYAIESTKSQTTFHVVDQSHSTTPTSLFSISKTKSHKSSGKDYFQVFDGARLICCSTSFLEALEIFRRAGIPGQKKLKVIK